MATIQQFEDLVAWQKARALVQAVYRVSKNEAFTRDFTLKNQIRRAAISVTSNIAEGFEREGRAEFINFLAIAKGSCGEVRSQLYHAMDENYLSEEDFRLVREACEEVSRILKGLMSYLAHTTYRGSKYNPTVKETAETSDLWAIDAEALTASLRAQSNLPPTAA